MANYGTFEYGSGTVYGNNDIVTVSLSDVEIIHPRLVRLTLSGEVLINDAFYNANNYSILFYRDNKTDAKAKRILTVYVPNSSEEALTTNKILVETDPLTIGTRYTFSVTGLLDRNNTLISQREVHKQSRRTKTQLSLHGVPSHFTTKFDSSMGTMVSAITVADDRIGGSEKELIIT